MPMFEMVPEYCRIIYSFEWNNCAIRFSAMSVQAFLYIVSLTDYIIELNIVL